MDAGAENGVGGGGVEKKKCRPRQKNPYKGILMRYGGKWVAEIYGPPRVWLGTYRTPVAAARAYDVALFYLRGPNAELNFPECLVGDGRHRQLTPTEIKNRAVEVGYRVDELQSGLHISSTEMSLNVIDHESDVYVTPDLNKYPSLDN